MSDIPEMSVQSTLTESTMQDEDISHSKTTVNALADVSNSTGPCSIPDISSRAVLPIPVSSIGYRKFRFETF